MTISLPLVVNASSIVAARRNGCARQLHSAETTDAVRVLNTDPPGCAVFTFADRGDIAGKLNQRGSHVQVSHQADGAVCRVFFSESAQINLHARSR